VAAIFAVLNLSKVRTLCASAAEVLTAHETAEKAIRKKEKELESRESALAAQQAKIADSDSRAAAAQERLTQILNEKKQLETKLEAKETEMTELQKQVEQNQPESGNPGAPSTIELQAQLDDARHQLESAEQEKALLAEKVQGLRERSSQLNEKTRRTAKLGIHGKIMAVNRAYNFVVLNLGDRNGIEPHSEMLILRDGTFIGKILISSVEPATAIGDIITSTLARGVQVQPGDIVIYAGSNS